MTFSNAVVLSGVQRKFIGMAKKKKAQLTLVPKSIGKADGVFFLFTQFYCDLPFLWQLKLLENEMVGVVGAVIAVFIAA